MESRKPTRLVKSKVQTLKSFCPVPTFPLILIQFVCATVTAPLLSWLIPWTKVLLKGSRIIHKIFMSCQKQSWSVNSGSVCGIFYAKYVFAWSLFAKRKSRLTEFYPILPFLACKVPLSLNFHFQGTLNLPPKCVERKSSIENSIRLSDLIAFCESTRVRLAFLALSRKEIERKKPEN